MESLVKNVLCRSKPPVFPRSEELLGSLGLAFLSVNNSYPSTQGESVYPLFSSGQVSSNYYFRPVPPFHSDRCRVFNGFIWQAGFTAAQRYSNNNYSFRPRLTIDIPSLYRNSITPLATGYPGSFDFQHKATHHRGPVLHHLSSCCQIIISTSMSSVAVTCYYRHRTTIRRKEKPIANIFRRGHTCTDTVLVLPISHHIVACISIP
ncbi:hypothetical protein E1B28_002539 [Marasmius oreades]|uniref:Uncharacterized protein n=1 Tax=Marasmius oreades TaxID=181124 RepID=A0A9P7RMU6_9AGAR|nr:uncharacterized protein E1B28_002539 [Marasmius oreades]KAG7086594.1 hypothetical protein E1B28_002539 [Marasmius oreades]